MVHKNVRRALAGPLDFVLRQGNLPHTPRSYQTIALESTCQWLMRLDDSRRAHIVHATGLGKTILLGVIVRSCEYVRAVIIVSNKALVEQTVKELKPYTNGSMRLAHASSCGIIRDSTGHVIARPWDGEVCEVLVTTDETFKAHYERIHEVVDPGLVIWDECHWAYTESAQHALGEFEESVIIGFTATPDYLTLQSKPGYVRVAVDGGQELYCDPNQMARTHFGICLDERGARWGIQNRWLSPLAWGSLDFELALDEVPLVETEHGIDFEEAALQKLLRKNWMFVINTVRKLYRSNQHGLANRYAAAICPGTDAALELTEALKRDGVKAECVIGTTPDDVRRRILSAGAARQLQFLASVFVLKEGWNDPQVEVAMMLRPTQSRILYMQFLGRALRLLRGKVALVLDPLYQYARFSPLTARVVFGDPIDLPENGGLLVAPSADEDGRPVVSPYLPTQYNQLEPRLRVHPVQIEFHREDGTLEAEGEVWVTEAGAARLLGLNPRTVAAKLPKDLNRRSVITKGGKVSLPRYFPLSVAQESCADYALSPVVKVGEVVSYGGSEWAMLSSAAQLLGVTPLTISSRLTPDVPSLKVKDPGGRITKVYPLERLRELVAHVIDETVPQAGPDGTFWSGGLRWANVKSASEILGISQDTVLRYLPKDIPRMTGKTVIGRPWPNAFFPLAVLERACANLLERKKRKGGR